MKIKDEVIKEWAAKLKYNRDRLNRIKKRIKKLQKQEKHFELRIRLAEKAKSGDKDI